MADPATSALAAINPVVAPLAIAASVLGFLGSSKAKKKQARASRRAAQARAEITKLENVRARRQQVREARVQQATALAQGATQGGTIFSSGTQGRSVGVRSQLQSNLSFLTRAQEQNDIAVANEIQANRFASRASTLGAAANLGLSIAGLYKS